MRIGVVTSKTAEPIIREIVRRIRHRGVDIEVIVLPIPAISMLSAANVARILARQEKRLEGLDLLLIPGTVRGDVTVIEEKLGVKAFKASRDPGLLPWIIELLLEGGSLSKKLPAEDTAEINVPAQEYEVAFTIGNVKVPARGPPTLLVAEVPPGARDPYSLAVRYVDEGADILVVGVGVGDDESWKLVSDISGIGKPVFSEAPTPIIAEKVLDAGAAGIVVSAANINDYLSVLDEDKAVIIGERDIGLLIEAYNILVKNGFSKIIIDPVVGLPLVDFSLTLERYRAALEIPAPILFSAANAATQIDADTHGIYALLASMSVELGASLFQVVEDTYKTIHSVAEAREALKLAEESWARRGQPHMIGSRLLVVKQLEPPPPPTITPENPIIVEDAVEPEMEPGHFIISVDHDRGLILVEYRRAGSKTQFAGRRARSLARVITRTLDISPEHAAYLGEELYKAELALRTGKTYIQDEELLRMVWED